MMSSAFYLRVMNPGVNMKVKAPIPFEADVGCTCQYWVSELTAHEALREQ